MESTPLVQVLCLQLRLVYLTVSKSYHKTANLVNYYFLRRRNGFLKRCVSNFSVLTRCCFCFKKNSRLLVSFPFRALLVSDNKNSIARIRKHCQSIFLIILKKYFCPLFRPLFKGFLRRETASGGLRGAGRVFPLF